MLWQHVLLIHIDINSPKEADTEWIGRIVFSRGNLTSETVDGSRPSKKSFLSLCRP